MDDDVENDSNGDGGGFGEVSPIARIKRRTKPKRPPSPLEGDPTEDNDRIRDIRNRNQAEKESNPSNSSNHLGEAFSPDVNVEINALLGVSEYDSFTMGVRSGKHSKSKPRDNDKSHNVNDDNKKEKTKNYLGNGLSQDIRGEGGEYPNLSKEEMIKSAEDAAYNAKRRGGGGGGGVQFNSKPDIGVRSANYDEGDTSTSYSSKIKSNSSNSSHTKKSSPQRSLGTEFVLEETNEKPSISKRNVKFNDLSEKYPLLNDSSSSNNKNNKNNNKYKGRRSPPPPNYDNEDDNDNLDHNNNDNQGNNNGTSNNNNSQLGLPRVYIPKKYADMLLNDEGSNNPGRIKKEKKLPLYMKVMEEAERLAAIEERDRNELISKVKRDKKMLGKVNIKAHMAKHDKMMKEKHGDKWQPPDISRNNSNNNLLQQQQQQPPLRPKRSFPSIKNLDDVDRSNFERKKVAKMDKLINRGAGGGVRGGEDRGFDNHNDGRNISDNDNDARYDNNERLPPVSIYDEGGGRGYKSNAYLRIQRENKDKKAKKELEEEERKDKLRRMREFGQNLRILASQKEQDIKEARHQRQNPYNSPKRGGGEVNKFESPRSRNISELGNRINNFKNDNNNNSSGGSYNSPNKTKSSTRSSNGYGNISQDDTVIVQVVDPISGKRLVKYQDDLMSSSGENNAEMSSFSLLSNDRTPFKSPKKVRFTMDDMGGTSQSFKVSGSPLKSLLRDEIVGSSDFLYSPSLKRGGSKKGGSNGNDDGDNNLNNSSSSLTSNNNQEDDPEILLSKVAGGPLAYHPDWVNQLLQHDNDEEKYAEIYEQGYSIMMFEHGIISDL